MESPSVKQAAKILPSVEEAANILQQKFFPDQVYKIKHVNRTPFVAYVAFKGETWNLFTTLDGSAQVYVAYSVSQNKPDYWFPLRLQAPIFETIKKNTLLYRRAHKTNPLYSNPTFFADDPEFNFDYLRSMSVPGYGDLIFKVTKTFKVLYFNQWRHSILHVVKPSHLEKVLYHTCMLYECDGWKAASYSDQPTSVKERFDSDVWDIAAKDLVKHEIAIINPSNYVQMVAETNFGSPPESSGESKVVDYPAGHDLDIHPEDHDSHGPDDEEDPAADAFPPDDQSNGKPYKKLRL